MKREESKGQRLCASGVCRETVDRDRRLFMTFMDLKRAYENEKKRNVVLRTCGVEGQLLEENKSL